MSCEYVVLTSFQHVHLSPGMKTFQHVPIGGEIKLQITYWVLLIMSCFPCFGIEFFFLKYHKVS